MITVLFLYRLVAWCFLRGMKFLSILMVGVALLAGGYGETKTEVLYHEDGSKMSETPYQKGAMHGTAMGYYEDGSKRSETPYVDGKQHGTAIQYNKDGSPQSEIVYENGEVISSKRY